MYRFDPTQPVTTGMKKKITTSEKIPGEGGAVIQNIAQPIDHERGYGLAQLLRTLFMRVAEGEQAITPYTDYEVFVEDIPELFPAFYLVSVFSKTNAAVDVMTHGPGFIIPVATAVHMVGVGATILRRRIFTTGSVQQQTFLFLSNNTALDVTLVYKVYRVRGLI